jgi:hypothetical protein
MKVFKTRSKPILKKLLLVGMVKSFENPKRKTYKIHKNENPFKYFNYVPIEHNFFDKQKENSFQKDF